MNKTAILFITFLLPVLGMAQIPDVVYKVLNQNTNNLESPYKRITDSSGSKPKYGYVDQNGKTIIPCEYYYLSSIHDGFVQASKYKPKKKEYGWPNSNAMYGYVNLRGEEVIGFVYNRTRDFHEQYAAVAKYKDEKNKRGLLWGFIDKTGTIKIPMEYDDVEDFKNGFATVKKGKWGVIDKNNKEIISCSSEHPIHFHEGIASIIDYYSTKFEVYGSSLYTHHPTIKFINEKGETVIKLHRIETQGAAVIAEQNRLTEKILDQHELFSFCAGRCWLIKDIKSTKEAHNYDGDYKLHMDYILIDRNGNQVSGNVFHSCNQAFPSEIDKYGSSEAYIFKDGGSVKVYVDRNGKYYQTKEERDKHLLSIATQMAEEGDTLIQLELASKYYLGSNEGYEVPQDHQKAFNWFYQLAQHGNSKAAFMVGWMYHYGQGTKKDTQQAMNWYEKSNEDEVVKQIAALKKKNNGNKYDKKEEIIKEKPLLSWIAFEPTTKLKDFSFKLGIKSDSKIEDVSVYVNGTLTRGIIPVQNDGYNMTIDGTVALNDGQNAIKVTVKNAGGIATTEKCLRRAKFSQQHRTKSVTHESAKLISRQS